MYHGAVPRETVSIFSLTHPTILVGSSFPRACLTARYKTRIHINKIIPVFMWFRSRIQKQPTVAPFGSKINTELSPVKQLNVTKLNLTWVETQILFKKAIIKNSIKTSTFSICPKMSRN